MIRDYADIIRALTAAVDLWPVTPDSAELDMAHELRQTITLTRRLIRGDRA